MQSKAIRIFFEKTDRIKYISHLDLQRTMQRALKRANLPVWETEGFNPHIYLTFSLALSLGVESVCESLDIKIIREIDFDEFKYKLNAVLPEGLYVTKVAEPVHKPTKIKKAEYEIEFEQFERFDKFLKQEKILIVKKTKKGIKEVDLKTVIELKSCNNKKITLVLPAGSELNINPSQVIDAYKIFIGADKLWARAVRTAVYCENNEHFE